MHDEGVIKFKAIHRHGSLESSPELSELISMRNRLRSENWIGALPDGTGYGNVSFRAGGSNSFLISASATGGIGIADESHFCLVESINPQKNQVKSFGPALPSSESMSHGMIYELIPTANAVIHTHSKKLWNKYQNNLPTTSSSVAYGTPGMAGEIKRLLDSGELKKSGVLIMGGHEDGIIVFGRDLEKAYTMVKDL